MIGGMITILSCVCERDIYLCILHKELTKHNNQETTNHHHHLT